MPNAPMDPNAPDDLLAPKAAELIAWLEEEINFYDPDADDTAAKLRQVITLLRERDALAAVIVERGLQTQEARDAIAKLHTTDG